VSQIILYQSEDGRTKLDVRLEGQTVWLSQKQLTELYGKAKGTISEHIKHIFEDGELEEVSVVRRFRTTAADSKTYELAHKLIPLIQYNGDKYETRHELSSTSSSGNRGRRQTRPPTTRKRQKYTISP